MRSHVEFRSSALLDAQGGETGPKGEAVARLLAAELPGHGYQIECVDPEDWGWRVQIANSAFPLWIGCGHYQEYADGHLCFIEPSRPYIRRWLKRVPTADAVERLATAIEDILRASGAVNDLRWWTEAEAADG